MPYSETTPLLVVVAAAGASSRFGGGKKEFERIAPGGVTVLESALSPFLELPNLRALAIAAPPGGEDASRAALSPATIAALEGRLGGRFMVVPGGATRRDSVLAACEAVAAVGPWTAADGSEAAILLIHDGARPWLSAELAGRVARAAAEHGAALPLAPLVDTPKEIGPDGAVLRHPPRASLQGAQTPQAFLFVPFLAALRRAAAENFACTDDAEVWDRYVGPVRGIPGDPKNRKVTYREDLAAGGSAAAPAEPPAATGPAFRVGSGWDRHRLVPGRRLLVGGVEIESELGEDAHSDGDVLLHAVIDALLGAAALGDIGSHFPPSDEAWRGADSRELARAVAALVRRSGWEPGNLDCTVMLERPRLGPSRERIRAQVAECLGMPVGAVSVKAKTGEGLDSVGEGRAIEAQAFLSLFHVGDRA